MRNLRALAICAAIAVGASLGTFAPAAMAAPPNDEPAGATVVPGALPVEAAGSNVGATGALGDSTSMFPGPSVWWRWEAPETRVVSVGTCGTTFESVVEVFALDQVNGWRSSVTPREEGDLEECASRRIFRAVAGTTYLIMVAGRGGSAPIPGVAPPEGSEVRPTEGPISLRIAPTPPPSNDDFQNATVLGSREWIAPEGWPIRAEIGYGYDWGATSQPGEPVHAGKGAGLSVWYRWTASASGRTVIGSVNEKTVVAVYTGSSLETLSPVASCAPTDSRTCGAVFVAEAGREYSIAVDAEAVEGEPAWTGIFKLEFFEPRPPAAAPAPSAAAPSPPVTTAVAPATASANPQVPPSPRLSGPSIDALHRKATIRFSDAAPGANFRCRVDRGRFRECSSPTTLRRLEPGMHRFAVRAHLPNGPGSRPAVLHFKVPTARRG